MTRRDRYADSAYLGDGLYAEYDGFAVWLTASRVRDDGTAEDHVVALEPQVMHNFIEVVMTWPRLAKIVHKVVRQKVDHGE